MINNDGIQHHSENKEDILGEQSLEQTVEQASRVIKNPFEENF